VAIESRLELDRVARKGRTHIERRAMLAVLMFAGLRIGELLGLRWRDVDLASGWLHIEASKTDAGTRSIKIRGALKRELHAVRDRQPEAGPDDLVFSTATGRRQSADNFRSRVLRASVAQANSDLAERRLAPLPAGITPHSLRRTFASVLYALGEDPGVIMDEMGHTDPALALHAYRQAMRRGEAEKTALRRLVEGEDVC
jgi:integrase